MKKFLTKDEIKALPIGKICISKIGGTFETIQELEKRYGTIGMIVLSVFPCCNQTEAEFKNDIKQYLG